MRKQPNEGPPKGSRPHAPPGPPALKKKIKPNVCDECVHFSGDGMNDNCQHPDYKDDGFNMNARPGRCRMHGCPLDNPVPRET